MLLGFQAKAELVISKQKEWGIGKVKGVAGAGVGEEGGSRGQCNNKSYWGSHITNLHLLLPLWAII